jgi:O-antigen ligase
MNRASFVLLWAFVFIVPWEKSFTIPLVGSLGRLAGLVALGTATLYVLLQGHIRRPGWFHIATVVFVSWAALSMLWTVDAPATSIRVRTYLQLAVFVWLIWELAVTEGRQLALLQAYVLGAYVNAFSTFREYLATAGLNEDRFAGLGYNPNDLGFILTLAIPAAWYLSLRDTRPAMVWINRLYVPIGMLAIVLTGSRGAFVPAIVALMFIPWSSRKLPWGTRAAVYVAAIGTLYLASVFVPAPTWERLASTGQQIETGDFSGRADIWRAGVRVVLDHPVAGVGAGAFGTAVDPILRAMRASHMAYLSVLAELGVVGLALFATLFITIVPSTRLMPFLQKRFWLITILTLAIGMLVRNYDYHKPLWFFLGLLAAQAAVLHLKIGAGAPRAVRDLRVERSPPRFLR